MAKLRHIAILAEDVPATATWYREAFELDEVGRIDHPLGGAVYLSDGTVNVVIIARGDADHPNYEPMGLNHIGFVVDDRDAEIARLEALGAKVVMPPPAEGVDVGYYEVKLVAPDGMNFDISDRRWPGSTR